MLTDQEHYQLWLIKRLSADLANVVALIESPGVALNTSDSLDAATNWIRVAHNELQQPKITDPAN